jgi:hypothetical protein
MSNQIRNKDAGVPGNGGQFAAESPRDEAGDVALTSPVPNWFVMPDETEQTREPLREMSLQTENRIAREAARMVNDGQLIVDAPYQRPSCWTQVQRQNLVKSWLRGIPVPPITINDRSKTGSRFGANHPDLYRELNATGNGTYACIDGRQRLETATAWFNGEFGVPASWFPANEVDSTVDTPDGPYVTYNGLTRNGQMAMGFTAKLPWSIGSLDSVEEEADLYVLLNTGGTDQSDDDIANAARFGSAG